MRLFHLFASVFLVTLLGNSVPAQSEYVNSATQRLAARIETAKTGEEAVSGYSQLFWYVRLFGNFDCFKPSTLQFCRELKRLPQDGVALRAAWEELSLETRFDVREANPRLDQRLAVAKFLGFVEGRVGVALPAWWEEAIRESTLGVDGGPLHSRTRLREAWSRVEFGKRSVLMPCGQSIHRNQGDVSLHVGKEKVSLNDAAVIKEMVEVETISATMDDEHCYVACYGSCGVHCNLVCIDRPSGKLAWKSPIWAWGVAFSRVAVGFSGPHLPVVSVQIRGDRVFVVGSTSCFHIEAFDRTNGKCSLRFSSSYVGEW